jgi:hypothetical protein
MGGRSGPASICSAFVAASAIPTAITSALTAGSGKIVTQYTSIFTIMKYRSPNYRAGAEGMTIYSEIHFCMTLVVIEGESLQKATCPSDHRRMTKAVVWNLSIFGEARGGEARDLIGAKV